jgi:nicotinic acid mononucleotide adenylyltransferase
MLEEFELLVAARGGDYQAPSPLRTRIHPLSIPAEYDGVSATEVRRRIAAGEEWESLAPEAAAPLIRELYRPT